MQDEVERPTLLPLNTEAEQTCVTDLSPTTPFQGHIIR